MIVLVFGSRPEAIKLGPVAAALNTLGAPWRAICTGQHTDLLKGTPAENDLASAASLGLASDGRILKWLATAERALRPQLESAALVVVQGDTMSALVGARAAVAAGLPVAHVEAGVRSHADEPWPEEAFRIEIDALASWYYAPTTSNFANLVAEGHKVERIRVTGNTVVSAMARYARAVTPQRPADYAIITLHRRELLQSTHSVAVFDGLAEAIAEHPAAKWLWPIHPNVSKRLSGKWMAGLPANVQVIAPIGYADMIPVLNSAFGVLTDSGGLQEEAATLGIPCAVLRNVTDRPESVEAGVAQLFPVTGAGVKAAVAALCGGAMPRRPAPVFGGVEAASLIAHHLDQLVGRE